MEPVLRTEGLTKSYRMGEVEVRAQRGVASSTWPSTR
jgi:hypothetical protein